MMSGWLATVPLHWWPQISVAFFFALFLGIVLWVYRPSARKKYRNDAQIPLAEKPIEMREEGQQEAGNE